MLKFEVNGTLFIDVLKKLKVFLPNKRFSLRYNSILEYTHGEMVDTKYYRMVVSDGYRLAYINFPVDYIELDNYSLTLTEEDIDTIIKSKSHSFTVTADENIVIIESQSLNLQVPKPNDKYPPYKKLLKDWNSEYNFDSNRIKINKEEIREIKQLINSFKLSPREKFQSVVEINGDSLEFLSSKNVSLGNFQLKEKSRTKTSKKLNLYFFSNMLKILKDSFVIKYDNDDYSPVIFDVGNKNEFFSILPIL